jgi:hypothetical protein
VFIPHLIGWKVMHSMQAWNSWYLTSEISSIKMSFISKSDGISQSFSVINPTLTYQILWHLCSVLKFSSVQSFDPNGLNWDCNQSRLHLNLPLTELDCKRLVETSLYQSLSWLRLPFFYFLSCSTVYKINISTFISPSPTTLTLTLKQLNQVSVR